MRGRIAVELLITLFILSRTSVLYDNPLHHQINKREALSPQYPEMYHGACVSNSNRKAIVKFKPPKSKRDTCHLIAKTVVIVVYLCTIKLLT